MKRICSIAILILVMLSLVSCAASTTKIIDLKAEAVLRVDVYDIHGPVNAKQKSVTEKKDIQTIMDTLNSTKITGQGSFDNKTVSDAIQFVFYKENGSKVTISCDGASIACTGNYIYTIDSDNKIFKLWDKMDYSQKDVYEYELPLYPKNKIPDLTLQYVTSGDIYNQSAPNSNSNWRVENSDGTSISTIACGFHPLDSVKSYNTIQREADMSEITLIFSMPPSSYSIRRWQDKYIHDTDSYEDNFETVEVTDNKIALSDDGNGYVYEVHANWEQGDAHYSFYISN